MGTVASCVCIFAPLPYIYHLYLSDGDSITGVTKSLKQKMSFCMPYLFYYMSGLFWTFFGYTTNNQDILFINILAVVCNFAYLFALSYYIQYNDVKTAKRKKWLGGNDAVETGNA